MRFNTMLGILLSTSLLLAQPFGGGEGEREGEGHRRGGDMGRMMQRLPHLMNQSQEPQMVLTALGLFVYMDGVVARLNKETLTVEKNVTLTAPPEAISKATNETSRITSAVQKMDQDKDGKVSKKEFLGKSQQFDQLDKNTDGFISAEEFNALEENVDKRKTSRPLRGAAMMAADGSDLILLTHQGFVFRLSQSDLSIKAQTSIQHLRPKEEGRPSDQPFRERGERPFPPKRDGKEMDEDFSDEGEEY